MDKPGIIYGSVTGNRQCSARAGFTEYDTYHEGFIAAALGNLDAPDYMPQGSVRLHNTMKQHPSLSLAHREWEYGKPVGCSHDGPEPATLWLPKESV